MKKIYVWALAMLTSLEMSAQCDFWKTTISIDGKYAAYNEKGECTIPPVFDEMFFWGTSPVCYAKYKDKYYLIDRKGYIVGDDGWDQSPTMFANVAIVGNKGQQYVVDFNGKRLTDNVKKIITYLNVDNVFCTIDDNNKYSLYGIDGKQIISNCESLEPMANAPLFKFSRKGLYGVCNMSGEIIVPAIYINIEENNFGTLGLDKTYYEKKVVSSIYTSQDLADITFLFAYDGANRFNVYDMAGTLIESNQEASDKMRFFEKSFKKYTLPYLLKKSYNQQSYYSKVTDPNDRFQKKEKAYVGMQQYKSTSTVSLIEIAKKGLHVEAMKRKEEANLGRSVTVSEASHDEVAGTMTNAPKIKKRKKRNIKDQYNVEVSSESKSSADSVAVRSVAFAKQDMPSKSAKTSAQTAEPVSKVEPAKTSVSAKAEDSVLPESNVSALVSGLPKSGVLPNKFEYYYATQDKKMAIVVNGSHNGRELIFSSSFNGGKSVVVAFGTPGVENGSWVFYDSSSKMSVLIKRDWSSVKVKVGKTLINTYDLFIGKTEYNNIKKTER